MAGQGPSPQLFFDTISAYQKSAALKAAIEVGLFTAVGKAQATAAEIAQNCRVAERGARILSDYLVTMGFLTKNGDKYTLTPDSAMFLDRNSPAYVGAAVEFMDSEDLRNAFDLLPDRVRAGGAPLTRDSVLAPGHDAWVKFARGMAGLQTLPAMLMADRVLAETGQTDMRVLDIAAGHGMFGIAMLQKNPKARVVAQDWQNVLEVAREHAAKSGVIDRLELLPGSAFEVDFGQPFDIVLLPNLLHHFDAKACVELLKRLHGALKKGGRIAVLEFVPNDDRVSPEMAARFALVMLANTPGGDAYTFAELKSMLETAGFSGVTMSDLPPTPGRLLMARK